MLSRRDWLLGWANMPACFAEFREVHPDEGQIYWEDLLEFMQTSRGIAKLAWGAFGRVTRPLGPHWLAIEPLLLHLIELDAIKDGTVSPPLGDASSKQLA